MESSSYKRNLKRAIQATGDNPRINTSQASTEEQHVRAVVNVNKVQVSGNLMSCGNNTNNTSQPVQVSGLPPSTITHTTSSSLLPQYHTEPLSTTIPNLCHTPNSLPLHQVTQCDNQSVTVITTEEAISGTHESPEMQVHAGISSDPRENTGRSSVHPNNAGQLNRSATAASGGKEITSYAMHLAVPTLMTRPTQNISISSPIRNNVNAEERANLTVVTTIAPVAGHMSRRTAAETLQPPAITTPITRAPAITTEHHNIIEKNHRDNINIPSVNLTGIACETVPTSLACEPFHTTNSEVLEEDSTQSHLPGTESTEASLMITTISPSNKSQSLIPHTTEVQTQSNSVAIVPVTGLQVAIGNNTQLISTCTRVAQVQQERVEEGGNIIQLPVQECNIDSLTDHEGTQLGEEAVSNQQRRTVQNQETEGVSGSFDGHNHSNSGRNGQINSRSRVVGEFQALQSIAVSNDFILLEETDPVPESLAGIIAEVGVVTQRMDQFF